MNLEPINYYFDPEKNIPATKLVCQVLLILKRRLGLSSTFHIPRIKHIIDGADVPLGTPSFYQAAIDTNGLIQIISNGKNTIIAFDGTRLNYDELIPQLERIINNASEPPPTLVVWNWMVDFLRSHENQAWYLTHFTRPHSEISIDQAFKAHCGLNSHIHRIVTATSTYYIYIE